ncbi:hypothetical protein B0A48_02095 [Cryoendolithus antarcticus]|uniref:Bilirubin oxidase n=1 Tax=Cryoendolithus antarcticus TaxID=1507870 RepID=A0A1V8TMM5_9PEZI|nr:hypothetical protein B0A48_02095 [Cryoendolithus antarcticus]
MFQYTLPLGSIAVPSYTTNVNGVPIEFYEITIEAFQAQMYPDLGPANFVGYNGTVPGPTFMIKRGTETVVRFLNKGTVSAAVHLHGSYTHAAWDGWAADEMEVGQWKDYYYPNSENARSIWYHDHADGHTAPDAYYGQSGIYIIYDPEEDALGLPSGKYDVPLAISDKMYQSNGDLADPTGNRMSFWGDIIHVNNQPWPFMATEPRKYCFRVYDMSLSRPYDLYFVAPDGSWLDFVVIGSDSGLFGGPVKTNDLTISPGERYEIVVDFGKFAGQNITLGNKMAQQQVQEFQNTDKVMLFQVGETVSDSSNNDDVPSVLNPNIQWPEKRTTVDHVFNFQMGGDNMWTINGIDFNNVNNRVLARPPQGTVELWEVRHTGGPAIHPVHIHLVNLQAVSRSGGSRGLLPYETAGLKDVVLLEPGEIVQVLAYYGPWNGLYMFHCHNLIHEDHAMMDVFNVTLLEEMGYDYNSTTSYADPEDTRFIATDYNDDAFSDDAVASAVNALANLNAYAPVNSLIAAQEAHYASAGYNGESATGAPSQTAAPESSGYGFATSTTAEFASGFTTMPTPTMARPTYGRQGGGQNNRVANNVPTGRPTWW